MSKKSGGTRLRKTDASVTDTASTPRHEYATQDGVLMHRVIADKSVGAWHGWRQIATLKTPSGVLYACTDYYHGSLPTNVVFEISEIK